jgi:hypothetical protein
VTRRLAAVFRPDKPIATKLQFIFNLFDYNMDDTLDPEELSEMISIVCFPALCHLVP